MFCKDFTAVVCHQLKSPAAMVAQYLDYLSHGLAGPLTTEQKAILRRAHRRAVELTVLLADWHRFAQVESGELRFEPRPVDLRRVIGRAWTAASGEDGRNGVELSLEAGDDLRPALGDDHILRELFTNLLDNALKHSPISGTVRVRLATIGDRTTVSVTDAGAGIPAKEIPRVFEPFFRGARSAGKEGLGVGLAIAKRIVDVHGGTMDVSSSPGRGATFTVSLPAERGKEGAL